MAKVKYADLSEEQKDKYRKRGRKWYEANRELCIKRAVAWHQINHKRHSEISKKAYNKLKNKNPALLAERHRAANIKHTYGLSVAEYKAMVAIQNNRCAICGTDKPGKRTKHWCIDHCHDTNTIRQLLCQNCNLGIGYFQHNIELLQIAIDYLKKFSFS